MKILMLALASLLAACATTPPSAETFASYYADLRQRVQQAGYSPAVMDASFGKNGPAPRAEILRKHANQPEHVRTFASYLGPMLRQSRLSQAQNLLVENASLAKTIRQKYDADPALVVALWGMESSFGRAMGTQPIIPALVTLGFKGDRRTFWESELMAALKIQRTLDMPPTAMVGSWAGAMGQCQFMPRTYLGYAEDGDGNGKADIWRSTPDVWASMANYLHHLGYSARQPWRLAAPETLNLKGLHINTRGLSEPLTLAQWHTRGLPASIGAAQPPASRWRYEKPQADAPAMLVGPNFEALLKWNNSSYFAFSALTLADMIRNN